LPTATVSNVCSQKANDGMELLQDTNKRTALITTSAIHILLLLLFIWLGLYYTYPIPQTGIPVNFGDSQTGVGEVEPEVTGSTSAVVEEEVEEEEEEAEASPTAPIEAESEDPVVTQEDLEALAAEEAKKKAEKAAEEAEKARLAEIKRLQEEEEARQKAIKQKYTDLWNNAKEGGTQGDKPGTGNQGAPNGTKEPGASAGTPGYGNTEGYSLAGRTALYLHSPKDYFKEEGKVVVTIKVDKNGKVIMAMPGAKGTNTTNKQLLAIAKKAALECKFSPNPNGPAEQMGSIEFDFVLE